MIVSKELSETKTEAKSAPSTKKIEFQITSKEIKISLKKVNFWLDNQIDKTAKNEYNLEDVKPHPIAKLDVE